MPVRAPPGETHVPYGLAAVSAIGGTIGFVKSRSVKSLAGGIGIGLIFFTAGQLIEGGEPELGHMMGAGNSLVLTSLMGKRYAVTSARPAAAMAILGSAGLVFHGLKWWQWQKRF